MKTIETLEPEIARNQRLTIAATLGAGLMANPEIRYQNHTAFANDALALADALIEASKTPPTP